MILPNNFQYILNNNLQQMIKTILTTLCLLPLVGLAQSGFTITGKVGSLNPPAKAFLAYMAQGKKVIDSIEISNGKFEFKGSVASPVVAGVTIKHDAAPLNRRMDVLGFYLENGPIKLSSPDSVKRAAITGSVINDDNKALNQSMKPLRDKMNALKAKWIGVKPQPENPLYVKAADSLRNMIAEEKALYMKFIDAHPNSYIAMVTFSNVGLGYNFDPKIAEKQFNKFTAALKESPLGKQEAETIATAKKKEVGALAMDFSQNDVNNKVVKLSDFKGKYVLIDFWASWCAPCRAENPNVVKAYNQLKGKNFEIIGVSLDEKKDAWIKAIEHDGLPWVNVSDLKGWKNKVAIKYGVAAVPQNVLLDPNGKVIVKNLRGEELLSKLATLVK
jgi:peroxiredoxin